MFMIDHDWILITINLSNKLFFLCPNCFAVNQSKTKVLFTLNKS